MLTDEEIQSVYSEFLDMKGSAMEFARRIECAVLAKVMPIPKQEPVGIIGETDCLNDVVYKLPIGTKLYTEPQPARAAAIPEIVRERMNMLFDSINGDAYIGETEERHLVSQIKEWLSASPKPE